MSIERSRYGDVPRRARHPLANPWRIPVAVVVIIVVTVAVGHWQSTAVLSLLVLLAAPTQRHRPGCDLSND